MTVLKRLFAGVLFVVVAAVLSPATSSAQVTEYPTPTAGSLPLGITAGPDGALWFTESERSKIGRITTAGTISEFPTPTQPSFPNSITAGPDGALWFTEPIGSGKIGRITTDGSFTEFKTPEHRIGAVPEEITAGPDGALWYTEYDTIGRITTDGSFSEFPLSGTKGAHGITAGPDGALWFAEYLVNKIGRITTSGTISEFGAAISPAAITAGPDGALWFTELGDCTPGADCYGAQIGRITTAGAISEFPIPDVESNPAGIATGPDGALWFTQIGFNNGGEFHCGVCFAGGEIGRLTTSGTISEFLVPDDTSQPRGITPGPDGAIWFTEYRANKIGRIPVVPVAKAQCRHGGWRDYPQFKNQGRCLRFANHR
jgi:virginiamycin B lyase